MGLDALADRLHDLGIDADQVVAAHSRLAGDTGGDDDDIGPGQIGIIVRTRHLGVEAFDRRGFGDVQRLALGHAVDDVEDDNVAQLFQTGQKRQRSADIPAPTSAILLRAMMKETPFDWGLGSDPVLGPGPY